MSNVVTGWLANFLGILNLEVEGAPAAVPRRTKVNLIGVTVTDDAANDRTDVEVTGGGGGSFTAGGDLTGDDTTQTVAKVNGTTITTAGGSLPVGAVLRTTAAGVADWGTVNLADADAVTGVLPTANQAAQSLTGDATGTTAAVVNTQARGLKSATTTVSVSAATAPSTGQVLMATSSTTATWQTPAAGGSPAGAIGNVQTHGGAGFAAANAILSGSDTNDYIAFGSAIASEGYVRCNVPLSDAKFVTFRRSGSTYVALEMQSAAVYLGNQTFSTRVDGNGVTVFSTANTTLWGNSALVATLTSASMAMGKPIIGDSGSTSPYGVHGVGVQAMADANQTPSAAVYCFNAIRTTDALTANRDLILPVATDAGGYTKTIVNACSGAFSVVVKVVGGAGGTVTIANGKAAVVLIDSNGVTRITADA